MESGWDVRRMIGTVPVQADGSSFFSIPANTPVAIQPLDQDGKALQLMRSWFVGMPGENVSCVGCHEKQNSSSSVRFATAARQAPVAPKPWYGPKRGFSFVREVQPVLDKHCAECHAKNAAKAPSLAREPIEHKWYASYNSLIGKYAFYSYGDNLRTIPGHYGARAS